MSWVAAGIAGGTIVGSLIGAKASKDSANTQAEAADRASQVQLQMYNQTRGDLAPWLQQGQMSLSQLGGLTSPGGALTKPFTLNDFQESPAYQFNLQQGQKAIENAASKNKTLYAPATLQDVGRFSQGLASNEFQNAMSNYYGFQDRLFNRLYSMSGSGQNAAAQTGAFGTNAAGQMGDAITGGAAARAAGQVGVANSINGGIGQGINAYMMNQILSRNQAPSTSLRGIPDLNGAGDLNQFLS